jgi:hypothetical protein
MAITRVQKSGRVLGVDPQNDARIIDDFMDQVIRSIGETSGGVQIIDNSVTTIVNNNFILSQIDQNKVVPNGVVTLARCPEIEQAVEVLIQDGGEFLVL